jgi:hypothetical protein
MWLTDFSGSVIIFVWMQFSHFISRMGIDETLGVHIGYLLSREKGYSLAACGFMRCGFGNRLRFPSILPENSRCKKKITALVLFLIVHMSLMVCTLISGTGITAEALREDSGTLACILYTEIGETNDRGFPNMDGSFYDYGRN